MRALAAWVFAFVACVWLNQSVSVEAWRPIRDRIWVTHDASAWETARYPFVFLYRRSGDERIYHSVALALRGLSPDREFMRDTRRRSGAAFERELPPADGHWHAPYTEVPLEYPPAALPFLLAPSYVSTSLQGYSVAFGIEMGLLLTLATALVLSALDLDRRRTQQAWWLGTLALLLHGAIAVQRLDALVAVTLAGVFWCWTRGHWARLGAALGAAAALKLLPLLLLLPIVGADPQARARIRRIVPAAAALIALGLGSLWLFGTNAAGVFFGYHAARGLHAESFAATLLAVARLPFAPLAPASVSFGSFNLEDPQATWIAKLLTPLTLATSCAFGFWLSRRAPVRSARSRGQILVAGLCVILLTAKVFSPQYLTWLIPFVALVPRRAWPWAALGLVLSQLYFRGYFDAVHGMTPLGIGTLLVRDVALIALACQVLEIERPREEMVR